MLLSEPAVSPSTDSAPLCRGHGFCWNDRAKLNASGHSFCYHPFRARSGWWLGFSSKSSVSCL